MKNNESDSRIKRIIEKIDSLNESLRVEYARLSGKYGFSVRKRTVVFIERFNERNKTFRIPAWKYVVPKNIRHVMSIPFIYMMIVPSVLLDLFISLYNITALPLYHIPKVKRKEHFIYDRQFLSYLNVIQKVNCVYCSYVNGLFSFSSEIAARTERYWCPVKAAHRPKTYHYWYKDFADYGNPEEWHRKFNDAKVFVKKDQDQPK